MVVRGPPGRPGETRRWWHLPEEIDDPGPGELILRYEGRSGRLSPNARPDGAGGAFQGEGLDRVAAGAFRVNAAGARLDLAAARVEKRGGDLALVVPARVQHAGTYWMYAELWGGPGGTQPVAFARERFERTSPGDRRLSISFGGAILRAAGIDGPYVVRNLRFQQVEAFPPQELERVAALSPTAAYRAREFE